MHKIDNLYLNEYRNEMVTVDHVPSAVHHIWVIDCSGSMSGELALIRKQIKEQLPTLLSVDDTVSIIWFSGRRECGVLLEGVSLKTLVDLQTINSLIDRWLKPVGLTGFVEPLEEIAALQKRLTSAHGGEVFSIFFMSDGCDNQWGAAEVRRAAAMVDAQSVAVVEYGYYADTRALAEIAALTGGSHIFAKNFGQYSPIFEREIRKTVLSSPKSRLEIENSVGDIAFALHDGEILTFAVGDDGMVHFPAHLDRIFFLSKTASSTSPAAGTLDSMYAAMSLFAARMMPKVVFPILRALGDVRFINLYASCFGKAKYASFQQEARDAAFDEQKRFVDGYDPDLLPRDDAFTVIEFLELLTEEDRLLLDHEKFEYNVISRRRESASTVAPEELDEMRRLLDNITDKATADLAMEKLAAIGSKLGAPELKFVANPAPGGYSVTGLVLAENRANISIRIRMAGTVDVSPLALGLPSVLDTFVWRSYAILKDGLPNVAILPMRLSEKTLAKLEAAVREGRLTPDVVEVADGGSTTLIHLDQLPAINRNSVNRPSAQALLQDEWTLLKAQAAKKVFDHYRKELFPKESRGFAEVYGEHAADALAAAGVTDYNGFNPKGKSVAVTDYYMARELRVRIKGFSSLPSVKDVLAAKKVTAAGALMVPHIEVVKNLLLLPTNALEAALINLTEIVINEVRLLQLKIAKIKYSALIGQEWFTEPELLDDDKLSFVADGKELVGVFEQKDVKVDI